MKYVNPTVTDAGRNLLTQTNGNGTDCTEIDQAIFSNQKNTSNKSLTQFTVNDFNTNNASVIRLPTVSVKHQTDTIQPEVNLDNSKLSVQYPVYMIGVLAHAKSDPNNEILLAVEESNDDPLILPKSTDIDLNCTFALPIAISRTPNVTVIESESGMVTENDFNSFQNSLAVTLNNQKKDILNDSSNNQSLSNSINKNFSPLSSSVSTNSEHIHHLLSNQNQDEISLYNNEILTGHLKDWEGQNAINISSNINSLSSINDNLSNNNISIKKLQYQRFNTQNYVDLNNINDGNYFVSNSRHTPLDNGNYGEYNYSDTEPYLIHQFTGNSNNEKYQIAIAFTDHGQSNTQIFSRYSYDSGNSWSQWN